MERIQKILARSGVASRREAERLIEEGRVTVNGTVVTRLGSRADPASDKIKVDGKLIRQPSPLYYLFHKPKGIITSMEDPEGRPSLGDWLEPVGKKRGLFPVGRLDFNSSGLLLLTNEGALAQRLTHPRYRIKKTYRVKLNACPSDQELSLLRKGIRLEDGVTAPARVRILEVLKKNAWIEIEIREGRYREVRRMFKKIGYFIEQLIRTRLGPISLGSLAPGRIRPLSPGEISALKKCVGL